MPRCRPDLLLAALLPLILGTSGAAAARESCDYDIAVADPAATRLDIMVHCSDPALLSGLALRDGSARAFVTRTVAPDGTAAFAIDLAGYAAASRSQDGALRIGDSILVTPAAIVPAPARGAGDVDLRFNFKDPDLAAVALPRVPDGRYLLAARRLRDAGEWVFGQFRRIAVAAAPELTVVQLDGDIALQPDELGRWIGNIHASNNRFWGRVPVDPTMLVLMPGPGRSDLSAGRVMAVGGATILLRIGAAARLPDLYQEWVLVHEFLHLGSPLLRDTGIWFNEGIATYFEPIIRARAGWKTEDEVWREWIDWMPRGVTDLAPPGLAQARRPYWGGALFLLLADVALRQRGDGKQGVEDCLRDILADGANITHRWSTEAIIAACDRISGSTVFAGLAERYLYGGDELDLEALWRDLGVSKTASGAILYDDAAPLAHVRQAIVWGGAGRHWAPVGNYRSPN